MKILKTVLKALFIVVAFAIALSTVITVGTVFLVGYLLYQLVKALFFKKGKSSKKEKIKPGISRQIPEILRKNLDNQLTLYFFESKELLIDNDIRLRQGGRNYSGIDNMEVYFSGERICTMAQLSQLRESQAIEIVSRLERAMGKSPEKQIDKEEKAAEFKTKAEGFKVKIDELNRGLSHNLITEKLDRTSKLLGSIHKFELENREYDKVRKLYDYYLPILLNILEKYKNLTENDPDSQELIETTANLEKTLDLINGALVNIATEFYEVDYIDVSTDMAALQSLLRKDGHDPDMIMGANTPASPAASPAANPAASPAANPEANPEASPAQRPVNPGSAQEAEEVEEIEDFEEFTEEETPKLELYGGQNEDR